MSEFTLLAQSNPIFGIALTVAAYALAFYGWCRFDKPTLLNPVLVGTALVSVALLTIGMPYSTYSAQTIPVNAALGIIIVLLAVPLYRQFPLILQAGLMIAPALLAGSIVAIATALILPVSAGTGNELIATLAPKSITAAIAIDLGKNLGGIASLTAVIVISTGIFGALFGPALLRFAGIEDERAQGFALGVASHAIGTARAFQISDLAGAFATLGMILNALLTMVLMSAFVALVAI